MGLDEMRSFSAAVEDLKPDAAYFVTTDRFTGPAAKFAAAKGITAAVLRPPRNEDWKGILRRIEITISMPVPLGDPRIEWLADPSGTTSEVSSAPRGVARAEDLLLLDAAGNSRSAKADSTEFCLRHLISRAPIPEPTASTKRLCCKLVRRTRSK